MVGVRADGTKELIALDDGHRKSLESWADLLRSCREARDAGPGSRAAGVAMAFKLIESAQSRWRAVNAPHLVTLVRAGATFERGQLVERPDETDQEGISKSRDTPIHRLRSWHVEAHRLCLDVPRRVLRRSR